MLSKHGVGYFERAGQLGPGETGRLEFRASEMDAVLKQQQVQAHARKLGEDDTQLAALRDQRAELEKKRAAIEEEIKSAIANMEF